MKQKQINKQKVLLFEEKELKEKIGLNVEQVQLILNYQEKFPELLQKNKNNEFLVDARSLWENLNQPQGNFADFARRDIASAFYKENGKNTEEIKYKDGLDYIIDYKFPKSFDESKIANVNKMNKNQLSRYGISIEYKLTVNCAKKIAIQQGNKIGDTIQDYFILIEETMRNYESWNINRGIEKDGWNEMEHCIEDWCKRKGRDYTLRKFYTREANLLNESLLGYSASEINWMLKNNDKITRDHLNEKINNALSQLQQLNCSLLFADMSFEQRSEIIKTTCMHKYSDLKTEFEKMIA